MQHSNKNAPQIQAEIQDILIKVKALINQIETFLDTAKRQKDSNQKTDSQ